MREILFRGKRLDNGEWVQGYLFYDPGLDKAQISGIKYDIVDGELQSNHFCHCVYPETVGQYTGLDDKDYRKIYEGDIVRFKRINAMGWSTSRVGQVLYPFCDDTPCFCVLATTGDGWSFFEIDNIKVIGNIHDNPKLLKEEK